MGADLLTQIHPPLPASEWWPIAAFFAVLLAIGVVCAPLMRRTFVRGRVGAVPEHLKTRYGRIVDDLEASHRSGERSAREVAAELSRTLRRYAEDAWGLDVEAMTLAEIEAAGITPLARAVAQLYDAQFSAEEADDAADSLRAAREVLSRW